MDIKAKIIALLKDKGNYTETDDALIDELIFNFILLEEAKIDLSARGTILRKTNVLGKVTELYDIVNKSFEVYNICLKNIKELYIRLGISPGERLKFKMQMAEKFDEFDTLFE